MVSSKFTAAWLYCESTIKLARSLSVVEFPKEPVGQYETFPHIDGPNKNLFLLSTIAFARPMTSAWPIGKLNSSVVMDFSQCGALEALVLLGAADAQKKRARYLGHEKRLYIFLGFDNEAFE